MPSNERRAQELADLFGRDVDLGDQSSVSYDDTRRVIRQRRTRPDAPPALIAYAAVYQRGTKLYLAGVSNKLIDIVDLGSEVLDDCQVIIDKNEVYILVKTTVSTRQEADTSAAFDPFPTNGSLSYPNNAADVYWGDGVNTTSRGGGWFVDFYLFLPLKNKVFNEYISKKIVLYRYYQNKVDKVEEKAVEDSTVFDNSGLYARGYEVNSHPTIYAGGNFYGYSPSDAPGTVVGMYGANIYNSMEPSPYPYSDMEKIALIDGQSIAGVDDGPLKAWPRVVCVGNIGSASQPAFQQFTAGAVYRDISAAQCAEIIRDSDISFTILGYGVNLFRSMVRFTPPATGRQYSIFGKSKFTITEYKAWISAKEEIVDGSKKSIKIIAVAKCEYEQTNDHGEAFLTPISAQDAAPVVSATGFSVQVNNNDSPTTNWPGDIGRIGHGVNGFFIRNFYQELEFDKLYFKSGFHQKSPGEGDLNFVGKKFYNQKVKFTYTCQQFGDSFVFNYSLDSPEENRTVLIPGHITQEVFLPAIGLISFSDFESSTLKANWSGLELQLIYLTTPKDELSIALGPIFEQIGRDPKYSGVYLCRESFPDTALGKYGRSIRTSYYWGQKDGVWQYIDVIDQEQYAKDKEDYFTKNGDPIITGQEAYDQVFLPLIRGFDIYYLYFPPPRQPRRIAGYTDFATSPQRPDPRWVEYTLKPGFSGWVLFSDAISPPTATDFNRRLRALERPVLKSKNTDKIPGLFFQELVCLPDKKIFYSPGSLSYKGQIYSNSLNSFSDYVADSDDYIVEESKPFFLGQFFNTRYSFREKLLRNPFEPREKETTFISYFSLINGEMRPSSYLTQPPHFPERKLYINFQQFIRDNDVPVPSSLPDGTKIADTFTPPTQNNPSGTDISLVADAFNLDATISLVMPIEPTDAP